MKAAALVFAVLLVLAHPAAAAAILGAELAACTLLLGLILRALRPLSVYPYRLRSTA
jgi:hypothetical protein